MKMPSSMLLAFFCLMTSVAAPASGQAAQHFWLGGEDPVTIEDKHRNEPADFMAMFQTNSAWQRGASRTSAFKISMQFASRASDTDLATVIKDLKRRGIPLAIEMGMLRNDRGCGKGEGYIPEDVLHLAMERIRRFGGQLSYVAMDEVVFFGREKNWSDQPGQRSCQDTIEEIVREVVANVDVIHQYFPQARIGAVEPITTGHNLNLRDLVRDYLEFADRYRPVTGSSLAFFHADIAWRSKNWETGLAPLRAGVKARGIRFGIIIGGSPDSTDDTSWTKAGLSQLRNFLANSATVPDDIIIQSWQPLPTRYLPETMPGTTTWMLLQAENMLH